MTAKDQRPDPPHPDLDTVGPAATPRPTPAAGAPAGRACASDTRPDVDPEAAVWDRMSAACPPAHRALLDLRRLGLPLREVAARVGLHEGDVRRALRNVARTVVFGGPV